MTNIPPFAQVFSLGMLGTVTSIVEMNEQLRFVFMILTLLGLVIKLWEQINKSEHFLADIKAFWKKIFKQKNG
jgi:hypothetical protein